MKSKSSFNLSILIITLNEENNMPTLLSDLDFADEIIVVDSFSNDKTEIICKSFDKVSFFQKKFENYTAQRKFAISLAKNDWILFIDADERLTPKLKVEIIETLKNDPSYSAYYFYRVFMFKNRQIHFSGLQNDKNFRLFNKNYAEYLPDLLVHENLKVNGKIGYFKNKLIHYSYSDFESFKKKAINYGKLKANEEFQRGTKPNFFHFYIRPTFKFLYQYIIRLGILDGKRGIIICFLNAFSVYVRFQELKKIYAKTN